MVIIPSRQEIMLGKKLKENTNNAAVEAEQYKLLFFHSVVLFFLHLQG